MNTNVMTMEQTMADSRITSLEIARVTGKQHKDVMKAIRNMEPAWEKERGRKFALSQIRERIANNGYKLRPVYLLTKTESLFVATKFNDVARARLVLRWEELETGRMRQIQTGTQRLLVTEKEILTKGDSEMYTTTGKKNPKRVIQLMVPEKSGDLVGDMKRQFDEFIAEMGGTPSPDPMERPLATQDDRLEVWLSKERHELVVKKTVNLMETPDYGTEISNMEGELRRCLLINRTSVLSACRAR